MLMGSQRKPLWLAGTAALSLAKILENMEIGHNVMHGQWDWMNDPDINSQNWDWDTASPADAWRHSHNYEHHTFTNIRGKDRDLGYEIMRIDPHQKWHPVYLAAAAVQPAADGLLRVGRGPARPQPRRDPLGREVKGADVQELKAIGAKAREQIVKDYVAFPALRARRARLRPRLGCRASPPHVQVDAHRQLHGEHRAQRVVLLDHLLRALPRPDVHVQRGGGRRRDARRLLRAPAARRREHRRRAAVPPARRQPQLPGRAPPVPGHALQALRRDRPARARHLPPLRAALQHRPAAQAARHGAPHDPAPGLPRRQVRPKPGAYKPAP